MFRKVSSIRFSQPFVWENSGDIGLNFTFVIDIMRGN